MPLLERIATALERAAPPVPPAFDPNAADAFLWGPERRLTPVPQVARVEMGLLTGIDRARDILVENTERFARGLPANNALLWGARGMGKSSLVKAAHAEINARRPAGSLPMKLVEIHREDIEALPDLMGLLRPDPHRWLVYCDDLSFDADDTSYKSLKTALDGGIEGRPGNVLFYATSNRRHLLARDMVENERSTAINPGEAVEEKVSLSDRFGLWLGFHKCSQDEYLAMIRAYAERYGLAVQSGAAAGGIPRMGHHPRLALGPHRVPVHPGPGRAARQDAGLTAAPILVRPDIPGFRRSRPSPFRVFGRAPGMGSVRRGF